MEKMYERIKRLRKASGMNQEEFAKAVGLSRAVIAKYETGIVCNLKRETISRMSKLLGVTPTYLMCMTDEPTDYGDSIDEYGEYIEVLRSNPGMRTLFDTCKNATQEDLERAIAVIQALKK